MDYEAGQITVIDLLEKYISLKQGVRYNTKVGYQFVLNLVKKEEFGYRKISTIKVSDAKQWFMKLQKDGRGYSTITSVRGVIKPAFQMAKITKIRKNPVQKRNMRGRHISKNSRCQLKITTPLLHHFAVWLRRFTKIAQK